nr:hypothetical protein [uncultured Oscillibacter sp.]
MKKSHLWTGLGMTAAGLACLAAALLWDTPLDSLLCGFAGALAGPGAVQILQYLKYTRPGAAAAYQEKLEEERINLRDERKEMLRNKAGRYAYLLVMVLTAVSILTFSVLGKLGAVEDGASRLITLFLAAFLLAQYFAGVFIYQILENRY